MFDYASNTFSIKNQISAGEWDSIVTITNTDATVTQVNLLETTVKRLIRPVDKQASCESRKLWENVCDFS
jgi:hypothetical protein